MPVEWVLPAEHLPLKPRSVSKRINVSPGISCVCLWVICVRNPSHDSSSQSGSWLCSVSAVSECPRVLAVPAIKHPLCPINNQMKKKSISVTYVGQLSQFCPEKSNLWKGHVAFDIFCQPAIKCFVQIHLNLWLGSPKAGLLCFAFIARSLLPGAL